MTLEHAPVGPVVGVADIETSRSFYEDLLGLRGEATPGGHLLHAGGGTVIYLLAIGEQAGSADWPVASFRVDEIGAVVAELRDRGVTFLGDDDLPFNVDERGIADQGDLAVAWLLDPDGNVLTVFSARAGDR